MCCECCRDCEDEREPTPEEREAFRKWAATPTGQLLLNMDLELHAPSGDSALFGLIPQRKFDK